MRYLTFIKAGLLNLSETSTPTLTMSLNDQIDDNEVQSNVTGDHDYSDVDLAKQEQDEDFNDNIPGPVSMISIPHIQPMVITEPVKKKSGRLLIIF